MKTSSPFSQFTVLALAAALVSLTSPSTRAVDETGPGRVPNASAPSHVFQRGDVEILTYETEQYYDQLQEALKESDAAAPAPGELVHRFYRSRIDGSVQPYMLWLPTGYSRDKKYPLVIQLHGTNFKEVLSGARLNQRGLGTAQWIIPDLQVICAQASGGPTTFYQGIGEVDVLRVIEEVKRLYSVDSDRVFIMGHSMGGAGSYTVGLHQPDQFGGIMAFDPAMGPHAAAIPPNVPKWMLPQIDIVAPSKLYQNARNVDAFFKNAGAGIQRNSTEYSDGIVVQGGFASTEVLPGLPHAFGGLYHNANWVTELIAHPIRRKPAEVKFYSNTLQYNSAYWVTLDRLTRHNADVLVTATCDEDSVRVTTSNLDALTLRLNEAPAPKSASAKLIVDGSEVLTGKIPDVVHLSKAGGQWQVGEWKNTGLNKHHGLQGPIGDAFNSHFLAVYGDGDRDLAIAELDALRNPPGPFDIHGDFPMKAAAKVTPEDIKNANLVLFGTPESNAVLKRLAPSLPPDALKKGAVCIYPNPENPDRYVVVWSTELLSLPDHGLKAGWIMPLNLLPDYVQISDGKIISGGHFDSDWKIDSAMSVAGGPVIQTEKAPDVRPTPVTPPPARSAAGAFRGGQGGRTFGTAQEPLLTDAQREALRQAGNQEESTKMSEKVRAAEQALKDAVLAQPCDAQAVQAKAEALAKLQAEQTVLRLKPFPAIASTLTDDQRERIRNAAPGSLQFMLSGFAGGAGGRGPGMGPGRGQDYQRGQTP